VIEPLCEDDIRAFVVARVDGEKDVERAEKLAKKLLADHRLRSLAENPMMLTMLAAIFGPLGDFPRNRGQLFKAFMDGVFAWEEQILKTSEMHLDQTIKESCLAAIAYLSSDRAW
jgi:predicted NACHT family NTPase